MRQHRQLAEPTKLQHPQLAAHPSAAATAAKQTLRGLGSGLRLLQHAGKLPDATEAETR